MVEPVRIELTSKILPYLVSTSLVRTNYSLIKKSLTIYLTFQVSESSCLLRKPWIATWKEICVISHVYSDTHGLDVPVQTPFKPKGHIE